MSNASKKRGFNEGKRHFKKNKKQKLDGQVKEGSNEEVLLADVTGLLQSFRLVDTPKSATDVNKTSQPELPEPYTEVNVTITELSSTGDGLGIHEPSKQVLVVPFTTPGDTVTAKVIKHFPEFSYSLTDFVKVVTPSAVRDDELVQCPYFTACSGCQFQMLPYAFQLAHKKTIVEKAYRNFSDLPPSAVPAVGDTIGSPLQYGYRTKLTPHFDGPPGGRRDRRNGMKSVWDHVPPIGFMKKGTRKTMDIEDCPIGTQAVRMGMKRERKRVERELDKYQRGATLLLRESTERIEKSAANGVEATEATEKKSVDEQAAAPVVASVPVEEDTIIEDRGTHLHRKTCITNQNATSTEYIDGFVFQNPAGSFFQNNNSILPLFTQYIRQHVLPPDSSPSQATITNLIDAYSGSGLFTITLSSLFIDSVGIDISPSSIKSATLNAKLNKLPPDRTRFIAADANALFAEIRFPAERTAVILDPPRKGCDEDFLKQLVGFGPVRVVYVSCNVHTQARDVGFLVREGGYEIESLRGFDFFPQTGHVEGVCVLNRRKNGIRAEDGADGAGAGAGASAEETVEIGV
ncbi:tRNA(m5U54)methyltransferase [Elasticomyces elasticus]|nr:tRNA(m5U54)methyltransferase [Elasticomyces elasticus]